MRFIQDLRFGIRLLFKHPGPAALSVFALALGLGLTTMMWSITYGALLRGLPFENADEILHLERARPSRDIESMGVPVHDFLEWERAQSSFTAIAGFFTSTANVSGTDGRPYRYEGAWVTGALFRILGEPVHLGRSFNAEEALPGGPAVVMIGWNVWQQSFGGDSAIIGRTLRVNGNPLEVIGVMPRGFLFPENTDLWIPYRLTAAGRWGDGPQMEVAGRLRPGVAIDEARADMNRIALNLAREHPAENEGVTAIVQPFIKEYVGDEPTILLWTMMGAVFGVLLIACSNVANLLLARAAVRTKEVAIRTALGASRARIVSLMLTESLVLSAIGAVIGTGIAWAGVRAFNNAMPTGDVPFFIKIQLDAPIFAFVAGLTVLAAVAAGLVPALQTTRANLHDVLKDESRGSSSLRLGRFSRGLVVAELGLSCGLLVGAGFMIQSVVRYSGTDYGVPVDNVFTSQVSLAQVQYPDSTSRRLFWRNFEDRLAALPGHRGVTLSNALPGLYGWYFNLELEGATYATERDYPATRFVAVSSGYWTTFGLAPLEGRLLTDSDVGGSLPVAVVTRNFAEKFFPGASPVGRRIRLGGQNSQRPWLTIVGMVPNVWYHGTDEGETEEVVIAPLAQGSYQSVSVAIAATGDPLALTEPVRQALAAVDPDQPLFFARTLRESIRQEGWYYAIFGNIFALCGGAALVLAIIGVYGVMSFAVSRRTQEVGVRMALGAHARDVLMLFLRQGIWQVSLGVVIGIGLAILLSKGIRVVLFRVNTANPWMYAAVCTILAVTGLVACYIPARRATRVDPMVALRYE